MATKGKPPKSRATGILNDEQVAALQTAEQIAERERKAAWNISTP